MSFSFHKMGKTLELTGLFLHMGPGMSAFAEAQLLAPQFPQFDYWQQPRTHGPNAYSELLSQTSDHLSDMYNQRGPVAILAHSFGVQIAMDLLRQGPERIRSCLFVGPSLDTRRAFLNLLRTVQATQSSELQAEIQQFLRQWPSQPRFENFSDLISVVLKIPDFMKYYWQSPSHFERFLAASQGGPGLDFAQLMDVSREALAKNHLSLSSSIQLPIHVLIGDKDPLVDPDYESQEWRRLAPQASLTVIPNIGHHVHLEWSGFSRFLEQWVSSP